MRHVFAIICILFSLTASAGEREYIWKMGKMPNNQNHQIAAMTDESKAKGFNAEKNRIAYIEWYDAPKPDIHTKGCMARPSKNYQNCQKPGTVYGPRSGPHRHYGRVRSIGEAFSFLTIEHR